MVVTYNPLTATKQRYAFEGKLLKLQSTLYEMRAKVRCHFLSCIVALCYLRLIELKLRRAGLEITASTAMERMRKLHSCLCWSADKRKPLRLLEDPTPDQALILKAFDDEIDGGSYKKYRNYIFIFR